MRSRIQGTAWLFFPIALFLGACVSKKETTTVAENDSIDRTRGVVTTAFQEQGCPLLIAIDGQGETQYLIPVQLPETFQQDGLEIAFTYRTSRIAQGACQMGQPAVLENVRRAKE